MPSYVYTKREFWQCVSSQLLTKAEKLTNEKKKKIVFWITLELPRTERTNCTSINGLLATYTG